MFRRTLSSYKTNLWQRRIFPCSCHLPKCEEALELRLGLRRRRQHHQHKPPFLTVRILGWTLPNVRSTERLWTWIAASIRFRESWIPEWCKKKPIYCGCFEHPKDACGAVKICWLIIWRPANSIFLLLALETVCVSWCNAMSPHQKPFHIQIGKMEIFSGLFLIVT